MKKVVVAVLVLVALGILYVMQADSAAAPPELEQSVVPGGEAVEVSGGLPTVETPHDAKSSRPVAEERVAVDEPVVAAEVEAQAEPVKRLTGRAILVDESGLELDDLDGEINVLRWTGNSGRNVEVPVVQGAFEVDLDAEGLTHLTISELTLEGRGVVLADQGKEYALDEGPIVIRGTWPDSMRLDVLSAETGAHLANLRVVRQQGWRDDGKGHPGKTSAGQIVLEGGASPLELTPSANEAVSESTTYLVGSPGFAWKAIHLNFKAGGDRELRLDPGGDLLVEVVGRLPGRPGQLRLWKSSEAESRPFAEVPVRKAGAVAIDSLQVGKYRVRLEVGDWFDDPLNLGELEVDIVAGERATYELILEPPPELVNAPLAGVVVVPSAWELETFRIRAELDGTDATGGEVYVEVTKQEMTALEQEEDAWAFDFGALPTGEYDLLVTTGGWNAVVEYGLRVTLEASGTRDVRIEVPPPASVILTLTENTTGEPAAISSMHWGALTGGRGHASSLITLSPVADGRFEFRAPLGEISLGAFGSGYTSLNEKVRVQPGKNEFNFRLEKDCPLVIQLMDGETSVPFSGEWWPKPEHLDGDGKLLYVSHGGAGFKLGLSDPGRYLFELPDIPGFAKVPQQEISVVRGEDNTHVVHLERE